MLKWHWHIDFLAKAVQKQLKSEIQVQVKCHFRDNIFFVLFSIHFVFIAKVYYHKTFK